MLGTLELSCFPASSKSKMSCVTIISKLLVVTIIQLIKWGKMGKEVTEAISAHQMSWLPGKMRRASCSSA